MAAICIILLFGVCLGLQRSYRETAAIEKPLPDTENNTNEVSTIQQAVETNKETVTPAGPASDESVTMQLASARNHTPSPTAQPEISFSQKRENKERTLMPGVTYQAGEGINMALDEDEKILIRRDGTYRKEVQVMWKKTF